LTGTACVGALAGAVVGPPLHLQLVTGIVHFWHRPVAAGFLTEALKPVFAFSAASFAERESDALVVLLNAVFLTTATGLALGALVLRCSGAAGKGFAAGVSGSSKSSA